MRVVRLSADPEVLLLYDFVSEQEAERLIEAADAHFKRSSTVCDDPGGCAVDERTSSSAAVPRSAITDAVQDRGRELAMLPVAETVQVVRYEPGQEYKPHLDAFDWSIGKHALAQYDGRQREATILVYLSAPEAGGETVFPELGIRVAPISRAAIYWRNVRSDGSIDRRTLHGGAPVIKGVKYAANLWFRGSVDPVYAFARSENVVPPVPAKTDSGSAAMVALGVGVGAAIGGTPGALVGGAVGWTVDAIRRRIRS